MVSDVASVASVAIVAVAAVVVVVVVFVAAVAVAVAVVAAVVAAAAAAAVVVVVAAAAVAAVAAAVGAAVGAAAVVVAASVALRSCHEFAALSPICDGKQGEMQQKYSSSGSCSIGTISTGTRTAGIQANHSQFGDGETFQDYMMAYKRSLVHNVRLITIVPDTVVPVGYSSTAGIRAAPRTLCCRPFPGASPLLVACKENSVIASPTFWSCKHVVSRWQGLSKLMPHPRSSTIGLRVSPPLRCRICNTYNIPIIFRKRT